MPKRPGNPYSIFNTEYMAVLRAKDPECKIYNAFKLSADKWNSMTEEEKEPY